MRFHLQLSYHYHQFFVFYVAQTNDFYEKPYNLLKNLPHFNEKW